MKTKVENTPVLKINASSVAIAGFAWTIGCFVANEAYSFFAKRIKKRGK